MPARDAAATIDVALRSVRAQSTDDWECVVVDDGSSDDTASIVREHGERDERIRLIRTMPRGIVGALNVGLDRCRGDCIARMDADDIMRRDRLETQATRLADDRTIDAVGSHVRLFPRERLAAGWRAYERWLRAIESPDDVIRERFVECPIAHPTLMVNVTTVRTFGWREVPWPEDYDLVLRMLEDGRRIAVVPRRLLAWRRGPGRLSETDPSYSDGAFVACKAHFLARGPLHGRATYRLWGYGHTGRALVRALAREGPVPEKIVDVHPGRMGSIVSGAPVVPPEEIGPPDGSIVLASVARAGPRAEIRAFLESRGFSEGREFLCVA